MNHRSFLSIGTICVLFLGGIIGCNRTDNPISGVQKHEYPQDEYAGEVVVHVIDSENGQSLGDVEVAILQGSEKLQSVTTDSKGAAKFKELHVGDYIVYMEKDSYEKMYANISVELDSEKEIPVVRNSSYQYEMHKKGVSVNGKVFYQKKNERIPAENATVKLNLPKNSGQSDLALFDKPLVTAQTDANGVFTFSDLPENVSYKIDVNSFAVEGNMYIDNPTSVDGADSGAIVTVNPIILEEPQDDEFIIVSDNLDELTSGSSISIVFSEVVDVSELTKDSIYITNAGGDLVLITTTWSGNTLTIAPYDGSWSSKDMYTLHLSKLFSQTGAECVDANTDIPFRVGLKGELGDVAGLAYVVDFNDDEKKIDYNTSSITLVWSPLANAMDYDVYKRSTKDSTWVILDSSVADTQLQVNTSDDFEEGNTLKFLVLGENKTDRSDLSTAMVIMVKDETAPTVGYSAMALGFTNSDTTSDTVKVTVPGSAFSEPMDTTKKPVITTVEDGGDESYKVPAENCTWNWKSGTSAEVVVVIPREKDASGDSLKIDCTNLTDWAGNAVDTEEDENKDGFIIYTTQQ